MARRFDELKSRRRAGLAEGFIRDLQDISERGAPPPPTGQEYIDRNFPGPYDFLPGQGGVGEAPRTIVPGSRTWPFGYTISQQMRPTPNAPVMTPNERLRWNEQEIERSQQRGPGDPNFPMPPALGMADSSRVMQGRTLPQMGEVGSRYDSEMAGQGGDTVQRSPTPPVRPEVMEQKAYPTTPAEPPMTSRESGGESTTSRSSAAIQSPEELPLSVSALGSVLPHDVLKEAVSHPGKRASIAQWMEVYERAARGKFSPQARAAIGLATRNLNNNLGTSFGLEHFMKG